MSKSKQRTDHIERKYDNFETTGEAAKRIPIRKIMIVMTILISIGSAIYVKLEIDKSITNFENNREQIIADINNAILNNDLFEAKEYLDLKPYSYVDDQVNKLASELSYLESINEIRGTDGYYDTRIGLRKDRSIMKLICKEQNYYVGLIKLRPENEEYIDSLISVAKGCHERESAMHKFLSDTFQTIASGANIELKNKYNDLAKIHEKLSQEIQKKELRKRIVERNFSSWDGSSSSLVSYVKSTMHNPDSFQHVSTRYIDMEDYISIAMKFRGTNVFGAIVVSYVEAKIDDAGNILQVSN